MKVVLVLVALGVVVYLVHLAIPAIDGVSLGKLGGSGFSQVFSFFGSFVTSMFGRGQVAVG